jgi:pyruvate,water dikinase
MARGFAEGTARFGLLLDRIQPACVNGFVYTQPVPFGAPKGAMGPPPKPVLWLLTRLHPKLRARVAASARAFEIKQWRLDLKQWDEVDKPAAIAKHRAVQAVDPTSLSDEELVAHVERCAQHFEDSSYLHHKYTATSMIVTGDLLAGFMEWTGGSGAEVLAALQGSSQISRGFAADELDAAAKAITSSDSARATLAGAGSPDSILEALAADPAAGPKVTAYLDAVRYRCVGYDPGDVNAGEMPQILVEALRAAVGGNAVTDRSHQALDDLRARIPAEHLDEFEERLAEARLVNRIRDERGAYGDGWAGGLARRALLEVGRRLTDAGKLDAPDHAADLSEHEVRSLLLDRTGPSADEVAKRVEWRQTKTIEDAPPFLRAMPAPPPPVEVLPPAARRAARAVNAGLMHLFVVPDTPNTDVVLTGLSVNSGTYEGTARVVHNSDDFGRIQQGDVLVTRMTSPYFNVVLPLLGALVTDRGGQLCHAAIVAREYGIPGIVGTREATAKIADGARVRVDGTTGEVHLLS